MERSNPSRSAVRIVASSPWLACGEWRDPETNGTLLTYVELTVEPGGLVKPIHNRAPLIIDRQDWPVYLEGTVNEAHQLVRPSHMPEFVCYPVSPKVNSVKAEGPELAEPMQMPPAQKTLFDHAG